MTKRDEVNFTENELEVIKYLKVGTNNRKISEKSGITFNVVKRCVSSIIHKLGVSNRTQAVFSLYKYYRNIV